MMAKRKVYAYEAARFIAARHKQIKRVINLLCLKNVELARFYVIMMKIMMINLV